MTTIKAPSLARFERDRKADPLKYYLAHPGQVPFHESEARERWIFGGNRSGKTEAGAAEVVKLIERKIKRGIKTGTIWVGAESSEVQRDVVQPKLEKYLPESWISKVTKVVRGIYDYIDLVPAPDCLWQVKFKNYEQGVDKWAGKDVDLIWFDEEPPQDIYKESLMRTIDRGGRIVGTMTPVNGMTWVFQNIWEKDGQRGIKCFLMDMDQNPHLPEKEKLLVLAGLTVQEKKIRKEGKFVALHGLVYPQFNEQKHIIEPFDIPVDWRRVVSIDPHLAKPTSVLWGAIAKYNHREVSKGDWVIYRELRRSGVIPDIAASILVANGRDRIFAYIADPALNIKDNITGVSPFDEFALHGVTPIPANKKVESGIYEVRTRLDSTPAGLRIFNTCPGVAWEFRHYSFADIQTDVKKPYSEKVRKRDDDYMDCLRYMINTGFSVGSGKPIGEPVYSETGRYKGVRQNA